jgi:hypothetical protein
LVAPSPESRSAGKKIQAVGSSWENRWTEMVSRFGGSKVGKHCIWSVECREGSCGQVAHPVSGDHVVDRWCKHTMHRKRSKWVTGGVHASLWRSQHPVDLSHFGDSQGRSMSVQHSNSRSHEL